MNQLKLAVGPVTIGLEFEEENLLSHFYEYFSGQVSEDEPQININIRFTDEGDFTTVPNSLFLTKKTGENSFEAGNGLIKGQFNKKLNKWTFIVHYLIVKGEYARVFEQILYQAYTSVSQNGNTSLIHSSGVIKDGWGYLFVGPSESGKSTVALLSQKFQVINDEINIVNLNSDTPILEGTPFNGLYREKKAGKAPLKGIFILNQAPFHGVERIGGGKAIKPLAQEIIPPIGLDEELSSTTYLKMMDKAKNISETVPIYRLDFLPDDGFWDIISKL